MGAGRPVLWYSYPRSSSDSKMSVSTRSHSMLVVFKFPSRQAPLFAGNAYTSACAASPEPPNRRLAPQPPHCACPERAQETGSRPSPRPHRLKACQAAQFCTCVLLNSEAGNPEKGRRTGCVAAGRGDRQGAGEGGSVLASLNLVHASANLGARRAGEEPGGSLDAGGCCLCSSPWIPRSGGPGCPHSACEF